MKTINVKKKKVFQVQHTGNELELNEMNESKLSDFNIHTMNKKREVKTEMALKSVRWVLRCSQTV